MKTTYKWREFYFEFTLSKQGDCLPGHWFTGVLNCGNESRYVEAWNMYGKPPCHEAIEWVVGAAYIGNNKKDQAFLDAIGFPTAEYYGESLKD